MMVLRLILFAVCMTAAIGFGFAATRAALAPLMERRRLKRLAMNRAREIDGHRCRWCGHPADEAIDVLDPSTGDWFHKICYERLLDTPN